MIGFDLKSVVVILIITLGFINILTYKEVYHKEKSWVFGLITYSAGFSPSKSFWYLLFLSIGLFIYGLYLNEIPPIILF